MPSESSLANLKPFQPGQSGNPGGRPKKRVLSDRYAELLETLLPAEVRRALDPKGETLKSGATWGDGIALAAAREAIRKGGTFARKDMREACEGKAVQRAELGAPGTQGMSQFLVVYANQIPGAKTIDLEKVKTSEDIDKLLLEDAPQLPQGSDDDAAK